MLLCVPLLCKAMEPKTNLPGVGRIMETIDEEGNQGTRQAIIHLPQEETRKITRRDTFAPLEEEREAILNSVFRASSSSSTEKEKFEDLDKKALPIDISSFLILQQSITLSGSPLQRIRDLSIIAAGTTITMTLLGLWVKTLFYGNDCSYHEPMS